MVTIKSKDQSLASVLYFLSPLCIIMLSVQVIDPVSQLQTGIQTAFTTAHSTSDMRLSGFSLNQASARETEWARRSPEARSEAFWLSLSSNETEHAAIAWKPSILVGDHIVLNYGPDRQRNLEVLSVHEEQETITKIVTESFPEPR